ARDFTPRGDAFGLQQPVALLGKLTRHFIEVPCQLPAFIARTRIHAHRPISLGYFSRTGCQFLQWTRYACRKPHAHEQAEQYPGTANNYCELADKTNE